MAQRKTYRLILRLANGLRILGAAEVATFLTLYFCNMAHVKLSWIPGWMPSALMVSGSFSIVLGWYLLREFGI